MKLLIDTHAALWLFNEHENLSQTVKDCLRDDGNELYISIASAWEVAIKHSLGKLTEFPDGVKIFFLKFMIVQWKSLVFFLSMW